MMLCSEAQLLGGQTAVNMMYFPSIEGCVLLCVL